MDGPGPGAGTHPLLVRGVRPGRGDRPRGRPDGGDRGGRGNRSGPGGGGTGGGRRRGPRLPGGPGPGPGDGPGDRRAHRHRLCARPRGQRHVRERGAPHAGGQPAGAGFAGDRGHAQQHRLRGPAGGSAPAAQSDRPGAVVHGPAGSERHPGLRADGPGLRRGPGAVRRRQGRRDAEGQCRRPAQRPESAGPDHYGRRGHLCGPGHHGAAGGLPGAAAGGHQPHGGGDGAALSDGADLRPAAVPRPSPGRPALPARWRPCG